METIEALNYTYISIWVLFTILFVILFLAVLFIKIMMRKITINEIDKIYNHATLVSYKPTIENLDIKQKFCCVCDEPIVGSDSNYCNNCFNEILKDYCN